MNIQRILPLAVTAALLGACTGSPNPGTSSSSPASVASSSESVVVSSSSVAQSSEASSSLAVSSQAQSSSGGVSQFVDLPDEFRISEDGERLEQGGFYSSKLYDESVIETIYLDFDQADFKSQLTQNYASKTEIPATLRYKDKTLEQVGVRYRGNTSYSRAGDKKSFSIDLEWATEGQDINGYNELKLNNGYEDPSSMREVVYANLARKNIPSARGNFVNLVVNGENYGVYLNIQKLEKDHVKEWFFDGDATRWRAERSTSGGGFGGGFGGAFGAGTSTLNDLGENGSDYEDAYTLKSATVVDPWQDLANAAHALGSVSDATSIEELNQYMDVDAALWFIATENIFTDDDGYINKGGMDYYVYFDLFTGRLVPIEYDGNSAMDDRLATSWNPLYKMNDTNFPLMNKLFNIPELRERYLAHYRTIMEESLKPEIAENLIDGYKDLINTYVAAPAAVREYSYGQFESEVVALKDYFSTRYNYLMNHADLSGSAVSITSVVDAVAGVPSVRPKDTESVEVSTTVEGNVKAAYLYYGTGLAGRFTKVPMMANGGQFTATIPPMPKSEYVRYYVEAIANNSAGTATYSPVGAEHDVYIYQVQAAAAVQSPVVINELVADNETIVTNALDEYADWIELYNNSAQAVDLSGWYLTDEDTQLQRWAFLSGTVIDAGATLVVWADDNADELGGLHANFKLSAGGEYVYLVNPALEFADQVVFEDAPEDQSYARTPNGSGAFEWTTSPSFNAINP